MSHFERANRGGLGTPEDLIDVRDSAASSLSQLLKNERPPSELHFSLDEEEVTKSFAKQALGWGRNPNPRYIEDFIDFVPGMDHYIEGGPPLGEELPCLPKLETLQDVFSSPVVSDG